MGVDSDTVNLARINYRHSKRMMASALLSRSRQAFSRSSRIPRPKLHPASSPALIAVANPRSSCSIRHTSTYYDSQSGLHLPVHDEKEIRLFLDVTNGFNSGAGDGDEKLPFLPHRMSKDRFEAEEVLEKLHHLIQQGIHGVILPPIKFPRDVRNLQTLSVVAPPNFAFLLSDSNGEENLNDGKTNAVEDGILKPQENPSDPAIFSKILNYTGGEESQNSLQRCVQKGIHTTISVKEDAYAGDNNEDIKPIALANNIATMIDATGGCDYLWISSKNRSEVYTSNISDTIVEVCEELIYLDVAGASIKSRLLVDSLNNDMLEDILFAGANKYVIADKAQGEMVEDAAEQQGKSLLRITDTKMKDFKYY